jgi:fluoroquinolone transport system permease protein
MIGIYQGLLRNDLRNIARDPMLLYIPLIPLVMAAVFRWGIPPLNGLLLERLSFNLQPYYPLIASLFLFLVPALVSIMVGFLLLDEKDENTILALLVSPLPLSHFLLYRAALPTLLGMLVTLLTFPLTNLAQIGFVELLLVCFLAALTGPINALFLAAFVSNKVAGLNMLKFVNMIMLLPIAAFLLPMPLQLLAGIVPHYWGMKVFVQAVEGQSYRLYALVAVVYCLTLITLLLQQFRRSIQV